MNSRAVELVREHLRAEDEHDVPAVLATFADECIYRIPAYRVELRGKPEIAAYYSAMFATFPDFTNSSAELHVAEDAIFAEVTTERTHTGAWGELSPTGRTFRTTSLAQFPVRPDGMLGGEIVYVDPADALHKIGALPSPDPFEVAARLRGPLAGRVALVTGASRGIGRAIAGALAGAGARVMLTGRDEAALRASTDELAALGPEPSMVVADLASGDAPRAVVEETIATFGRLDILVNAAGGTVRGPALEMSLAEWHGVLDVNLTAAFLICREAGRVMRDQLSGGVIVNVTSLNGVVGNAWAAGYAASKGGLVQLTRSLALEWAGAGIRVNAIGPGFVETEMTAPVLADPERRRRILEHIPMGRLARPDDLGGAAVFLASDASSYLTGQVVYVDGGYLCV